MRKIVFSILAITICSCFAYGKDEVPATKLEVFKAKTGTVIIKGYTEVGEVKGQYGGGVTLHSKDFMYPSNLKLHLSGISFTVNGGSSEREDIAFVDFDEIDSLVSGIDYISKATKEITYLNEFEASYKTKGDLEITVFSQSEGGLGVYVKIDHGYKVLSFIEMKDLPTLRELIIKAKSNLKP
jgi:hypothetical protein